VAGRNAARWADVLTLARRGINSPLTSSAGRLFDAISALLGLRDIINYEGQAAIELEQLADPGERGSYPVAHRSPASGPGPIVIDGADLMRAAADDLTAGVGADVIAARFHNAMADLIADCCATLRDTTGLTTVALSGGVFQNLLLLDRTLDRLRAGGFEVLTHSRVPTNDGGISLGQAAIAAARDLAGRH
jgi:hydrogenase maturation protein HypF